VLHLSRSNLGTNQDNIKYLDEALRINTSIQGLDLSRNNFGEGIKNKFKKKFSDKYLFF